MTAQSYDLFTGRTNQSGGAYRRSLIYFDLSALPSGAVIDSVSLTMVMSGGAPSGLGAGGDHPQGYTGPLDISLDRMLANWGAGSSGAGMGNGGSVAPGTGGPPGGSGGASHGFAATPGDATWIYNFFNTSSWTTPGGDYVTTPSATQGVSINPQYVTWSSPGLVSDVQGWVNNPATDFGWMIVGDESTNGTSRLFVSSESPNTAYRPALTIVYDVPTIGTQPASANHRQRPERYPERHGGRRHPRLHVPVVHRDQRHHHQPDQWGHQFQLCRFADQYHQLLGEGHRQRGSLDR